MIGQWELHIVSLFGRKIEKEEEEAKGDNYWCWALLLTNQHSLQFPTIVSFDSINSFANATLH